MTDIFDTTLPEHREPRLDLTGAPPRAPRPRGRPKGSTKVKAIVEAPGASGTVFHAMPTQGEFLSANEREVMFSGGMGSGKSVALLVDMVASVAGNPGARAILARKHLASLNRSTLPILLSNTGDMPPVLPPGSYEFRKSDGIIRLNGGGEIMLLGCDHFERIRSINASDLYVDEAAELTQEMWMELMYRIRLTTGRGHVRCCTNPKYINHWLHDRFIANPEGRKVVYGDALSNKYLSEESRKLLSSLKGDRYLRYVKGIWTARGEMVYPEWDSTTMVSPQEAQPGDWYIGVDFGGTNPTAMLACFVGEDDVLRVVDEFYRVQSTFSAMLAWCEKYRPYNCTVIRDPSAKSVETEFAAAGWNVVNGDNSVDVGIERVRDRLAARKLAVDPKCRFFTSEMDGYSWDEDKPGKVVKEKDHACDALRYVCGAVTGNMIGSLGSVNEIFFA